MAVNSSRIVDAVFKVRASNHHLGLANFKQYDTGKTTVSANFDMNFLSGDVSTLTSLMQDKLLEEAANQFVVKEEKATTQRSSNVGLLKETPKQATAQIVSAPGTSVVQSKNHDDMMIEIISSAFHTSNINDSEKESRIHRKKEIAKKYLIREKKKTLYEFNTSSILASSLRTDLVLGMNAVFSVNDSNNDVKRYALHN